MIMDYEIKLSQNSAVEFSQSQRNRMWIRTHQNHEDLVMHQALFQVLIILIKELPTCLVLFIYLF